MALENAALKRHATLQEQRAQALRHTLAAERRGEALAAALATAESERNRLGRERDDAIRKNTTGRRCLDAPVVRLLDAGNGPGLGLPAPSSLALDAAAAAAADSDDRRQGTGNGIHAGAKRPVTSSDACLLFPDACGATDTDVALWARHARDQYDACRGRIDALRGFYSTREAQQWMPMKERG